MPPRDNTRSPRRRPTPVNGGGTVTPLRRRRPVVVPLRALSLATPVQAGLRLTIVGVGIAVLAGTLIAAWKPATQRVPRPAAALVSPVATAARPTLQGRDLGQTEKLDQLEQKFGALAAAQKDLKATAFLIDLDTGRYADYNGEQARSAASTIKIPVLAALMEEVNAGRIRLDEKLTMRKPLIASEAGAMQYLPVNSRFTVLETAIEMIRISDNTATNLLIDRLGGKARLNQRFQTWGLQQTRIGNLLPDLEGANKTSARDLVTVLAQVERGERCGTTKARDRFWAILRTAETNTLINRGVGPGTLVAHKTGDIAISLGDAGLVDLLNGKRYIIGSLVGRPDNDQRANDLIRAFSTAAFQVLNAKS